MSVLIGGLWEHEYKKLRMLQNRCLSLTQKYNQSADAVRPLRPDDLGRTELTYHETTADTTVVSYVNSDRVDASRGVLICGFCVNDDMGEGGYITVEVNGVKKMEVMADLIWLATNKRMYCFDQATFVKENVPITVKVYQNTGSSIELNIQVLGFIAGNKADIMP